MRRHQPVHVLYGGGHLFKSNSVSKLGRIALETLDRHLPGPEALAATFGISNALAETIYPRLRLKLEKEPVEEIRIDFEDGYGARPDAEEDEHAAAAAKEMAGDGLPGLLGLRIRALRPATERRALRTLEIFLRHAGRLPAGFVLTLPKIESPLEVNRILNYLPPEVGLEIMIETTQALDCLGELIAAGGGRITGAHFGPYDFLTSCGVAAVRESLQHPLCNAARAKMLFAYARHGIALSDGPTKELPLGDAPQHALRLHFNNVQAAMGNGFYQGWDLHPAQLPARYAACFAYFWDGALILAQRLENFIAAKGQATRIGQQFDDEASIEGLRTFFSRAVQCGAMTTDETP